MTDLASLPVPDEGPIRDKIRQIYERSFPPEEQITMCDLLRAARKPGVSFDAWTDASLPAGEAGADHVVEVYVGYLRRKTEQEGEPRLIHTVRGVGYVLRDTAP